jgi:hypothetical protein
MRNFTNPLDNIHIASPCSADWNEMYGDDRKRFCGDCKLNVYNLSDMTRDEAENLLMISEGRLCVRFFRRADGTVLTRNCPVGWRAVKQKTSRMATAAFSVLTAFFAGMLTMRASDSLISLFPLGNVPPVETTDYLNSVEEDAPEIGDIYLTEWEGQVSLEDVRGRPSPPIRSIDVMGRP